ncbi:MAG: hypothetical protein WA118_07370 [Carboxydocellales bacterium]
MLEKLKGIGFIANDYLVLYLEDNFNILERSSFEPWPEELADEEEKVQWVHILTSAFDFSAQTPEKRK